MQEQNTTFTMPDFLPALPEMFLLGAACVVLLADLFFPGRNRGLTWLLSLVALAGTAVCVLALEVGEHGVMTFSNTFVLDQLAILMKLAVLAASATVLVYSRHYLAARDLHRGEFYTLTLFSTLGMLVIISAPHLLTLYLGLELMSLCLYALVALNRDSAVGAEAAMKYFVLGAIASGLLLYGMSIIYGVTGSLQLDEIAAFMGAQEERHLGLILALTFVVAGLAFKLGAVPFHMWLPDVYHGAPTPVTLLIGSAPKIAAFALVFRLLVEGMEHLYVDWRDIFILMSVLSLVAGSVVAIAQTNIKRMLAYSTIGHIGFLLMGFIAGTSEGYSAALFYALVYVLMALGAFGMILLLSRKDFEADNLDDFRGLNARSPWFALVMLLVMFSMAGVPPTIGFHAKLAVLSAVVNAGFLWLAVLGVIAAIVSAFYYLRVVKLMYFDEPQDNAPLSGGIDMRILLSANGIAVLVLGLMPGALLTATIAAIP